MNRLLIALLLCAAPAPAALAADAPRPKAAAKAAPALSRTAGKVLKSSGKKQGSALVDGRLSILDDAGHYEDFLVDAKTKVTCDGKTAPFLKAAVPGACDRAARVLYDLQTKRVAVLELKTALKADADAVKAGRSNASGEVAATDVLAGRISVRLGGGTTLDFKVGEATKITGEAAGDKPASAAAFESVKVGDRVEIFSKDWKTADEIRVRPAAR
jgi:hypothetical protein